MRNIPFDAAQGREIRNKEIRGFIPYFFMLTYGMEKIKPSLR